jgi:hypothetical protein
MLHQSTPGEEVRGVQRRPNEDINGVKGSNKYGPASRTMEETPEESPVIPSLKFYRAIGKRRFIPFSYADLGG